MKFCFTNRITNLTELTEYVNAFLKLFDKEQAILSEENVKLFIGVTEAQTYERNDIAYVLMYGTPPLDINAWITALYEISDYYLATNDLDSWLDDNSGTINNPLNELLADFYKASETFLDDKSNKLTSREPVEL